MTSNVDDGVTAEDQARRRVAVVVGSTRPTRICPGIAQWVMKTVQEGSPLEYELIDLAEVNLPFLDEPFKAALGRYEHEHTRAWSRTVSSFDGFIFVFPQYNWGYPAPLKNALDFLYHEWAGKPSCCVTYGTRGGPRSAAQMRSVFEGLKMQQLDNHVEVSISAEAVDEEFQLRDVDGTLQPYLEQTRALDAQMVEALLDVQ